MDEIEVSKPEEVSKEKYYYYLEVLPPIHYGKNVRLVDGTTRDVDFGFAEGWERVMAFWKDGDKFFRCNTTEVNHGN